jgi:hypothetical protein
MPDLDIDASDWQYIFWRIPNAEILNIFQHRMKSQLATFIRSYFCPDTLISLRNMDNRVHHWTTYLTQDYEGLDHIRYILKYRRLRSIDALFIQNISLNRLSSDRICSPWNAVLITIYFLCNYVVDHKYTKKYSIKYKESYPDESILPGIDEYPWNDKASTILKEQKILYEAFHF